MPTFSATAPTLKTADHTSEGFCVKRQDGVLVEVFRLVPGEGGRHHDPNGKLVKRLSSDNGASWTAPVTIIDNIGYDDRNPQGGITDTGRIFFLYLKDYVSVDGQGTVTFISSEIRAVYSDDGGNTWTESSAGIHSSWRAAYGPVTNIPGVGWTITLFGYPTYKLGIISTLDGIAWGAVSDITTDSTKQTTEAAIAYLGDGHVTCICRRENAGMSGYWQFHSSDSGVTWSSGQWLSALSSDAFYSGPWLYVDEGLQQVWLMHGERHFENRPWEDALRFLVASVADLKADSPLAWSFVHQVARPESNGRNFYGYPSTVSLGGRSVLVRFSEATWDAGALNDEDADLYVLTMTLDTVALSGGVIRFTEAPVGRRSTFSMTVAPQVGGEARLSGADAARMDVSLNGDSWASTATLSPGSQTLYVGVTPSASDGRLSARLEVPT